MKHNKPLIALSVIAISLLAESGSAIAGPDWATIERARAAKQAEQAQRADILPCPQQTAATQVQLQNQQKTPQTK